MNGIDNSNQLGILQGKKLGLITNPTGVDAQLRSTAQILHEQFDLRAVFGPEHGIRGDQQAGVQVTDGSLDPELGVPSYSLYGKNLTPQPEMLEGLDMMVYDIQDVGARFYTYIYTLSNAMQECAKHGVAVTVLDRANPLGGKLCEGIRLSRNISTFVGKYPIPTRYALTVGEFARYINETYNIGCELHVVPCKAWRRDLWFDETGLPWVPPSPNIPTLESAIAYIGTCIFEGTNASEGRGTTHPFEILGAPWLNASRLVEAMNKHQLPGVLFRPAHFTPTFSKFTNKICHGLQIHITNRNAFRAFDTGLWLFHEMREQSTEFLPGTGVDRLFGNDSLRTGSADVPDIIRTARQDSAEFLEEIKPFLLY